MRLKIRIRNIQLRKLLDIFQIKFFLEKLTRKKKKKKVTYCLASGRSPSAIGTIDVMWVSGP
jgi:rhodanese-related sulfurtransferase